MYSVPMPKPGPGGLPTPRAGVSRARPNLEALADKDCGLPTRGEGGHCRAGCPWRRSRTRLPCRSAGEDSRRGLRLRKSGTATRDHRHLTDRIPQRYEPIGSCQLDLRFLEVWGPLVQVWVSVFGEDLAIHGCLEMLDLITHLLPCRRVPPRDEPAISEAPPLALETVGVRHPSILKSFS